MNEELKLDQLTYTFDLLVLSTLDHLFFYVENIYTCHKTSYFNEEANCTWPSTSAISLDKIDSHSKK
jgi:hypothetical protein